ncbi:hypothetical protein AC249_AIPGENE7254 [Exaiptasia diaphana]|nr:hypothetical protein AC249_AIPGENE7254 [Exaiptasia diaphana]
MRMSDDRPDVQSLLVIFLFLKRRRGGEEDRRTGGEEERRRGGEEDRRTGGQEDRRTGGQEDRRTGGQLGFMIKTYM